MADRDLSTRKRLRKPPGDGARRIELHLLKDPSADDLITLFERITGQKGDARGDA